MKKLSCITPNGQITIPRNIMKTLGISGGSDILIEVLNGVVVLKKIEVSHDQKESKLIYKAV
ncbi:MAG: AbrB/MazE/SpoVT family DNA-binding domain-containing protein [Desulfotomaculaceae bacterium]|nr:AbrB/MazE/SpoVT family DNA-binding domain-containing protein [Desulfotomaculaceae bacterium]